MSFDQPPKPTKPPSGRPNRAIAVAIAVGLGGGLLLSVPLSRMFTKEAGMQPPLPVSNPFTGWMGFGAREVVVLGRDLGGGNTDAIFTVRVDGGTTVITQIPRDSYIDADGFGGMKLNSLLARGGPEAVERELTWLMDRPIRPSRCGAAGCDSDPR